MAWMTTSRTPARQRPPGSWLTGAGFTDVAIEPHDEALVEMIRDIGKRLLVTEVLAGLKINLAGIDLSQAKRLTQRALIAAHEQRLGYAIVCAAKR